MRVSVYTSAISSAPLTVLCLDWTSGSGSASASPSRPGWPDNGGAGIGVGRPNSLDGSVASTVCCEEGPVLTSPPPNLVRLGADPSSEPMVSGVDFLRLFGDEPDTTISPWPPWCGVEWPCPWPER